MTRIYARNLDDALTISGGHPVDIDYDAPTSDGLLPFLIDDDITVDLDDLDAITRLVVVAAASVAAAIAGGLIWLTWKATR